MAAEVSAPFRAGGRTLVVMRNARVPLVTVPAFLAALRAGAVPEGPRAELVGGRVRPAGVSSPSETAVIAHLVAQLGNEVAASAGSVALLGAPLRLGPGDLLRADLALFPTAAQPGGAAGLTVGGSLEPAAALLVVELARGRATYAERAPLYAAAAARELWLIDVRRGFTEALRAPWRGLYRSRTLWYPGEAVRIGALGLEVVPLPAA